MISILFVCLGNICRSPMAEAVFRQLVHDQGLESKIHMDSAGIGNWHVGKPPHNGALEELRRHHISTEGLFGRQLTKQDFKDFDLIIAMDDRNVASIKDISAGANINLHLLTDFSRDPNQRGKDVPDPYHTNRFQETYEIVEDCCHGLLEYVKPLSN